MSDTNTIKKRKKKKKSKKIIFAIKQLLKFSGLTLLTVLLITLSIASFFAFSFRSTEKIDECTIKIRTQRQTRSTVVKTGDEEILQKGYFPLTALDGIVGIRAIGDQKGIVISNPSGTETLEITPDANIICVNGTWLQVDSPILYKLGECYLPLELLDKYTCLSVSYDESTSSYTVSTAGTKDISFFPQNNTFDLPA